MVEMEARAAPRGTADRPASDQGERVLSPAATAVAALQVPPAFSPVVVSGIARAIESCLMALTGAVALAFYVIPNDALAWAFLVATAAIPLLAIFIFQELDLYQVAAFRWQHRALLHLLLGWTGLFAALIAFSYLIRFGGDIAHAWLGMFYVGGLAVLLVFRAGLYLLVTHWTRQGRLDRRAVVVGADANGEALIEKLEMQPDSDVRILGVFDDRGDDRTASVCGGHLKLGNVSDLVEFARRTRVDLVLFALPISAETRILQMLKKLWVLPVDIRLSAHTNKLRFRPRSYSYIGNVPVLDVFDRPITDWDVVSKWLFDKLVGGLMLLLFAPLMAVVAILIKLDSRGPVFFKQKRHGFNNEAIEVYKFRSLYADKTDAQARTSVTKDDPRVTRVGRFIRKTSIDELPQLINVVIKGNLSLVGPRPHAVSQRIQNRLFDETVDGYFARHRVKPGMTGWAQINGLRGEIDSPEKIQRRVAYDLYYIENWSVLFDLYILFKTPFALLKAENAY